MQASKFYPVSRHHGEVDQNETEAAGRTKAIVIRLTPDEHDELRAKALAAGLTMSQLFRDHIGRVRIYNHKEKARWLQILVAINNNLAALVERTAGLQPADAALLIAYSAAIHRQLENLIREAK